METKFLVSLMLLQAIINGVNLARHPDRHGSKCSKNGDLNSNALLKSQDVALDELDKSFRLPFTGAQRSNNGGIWAHALCPPPPKYKMEWCRKCLKDTIPFLKKDCPKHKEGATWSILPYTYCMVRYADHPNQGNLAEWAWVQFDAPPGLGNATAGELEKAWNNLGNTIMEKAIGVKNLERYGYGSVPYGPAGSQKLYGSMQCAPNISDVVCKNCLSDGTMQLNECSCKSRKESRRTFSVNGAVWYSHARIIPDTLPTISAP